MDEWESVERKLKELQNTFLKKGPVIQSPHRSTHAPIKDNAPVSDFWRQRYEQEKQLWEEKIASKQKEQEHMQEKMMQEAQSTLDLNLKIEALMRQFETAKSDWAENPKVQVLESEIQRQESEYGLKIQNLTEENERLKEEIVRREKELALKEKDFIEQEIKKREVLENEKKKAEDQNIQIEKELFALRLNLENLGKEKDQKIQQTLQDFESQKKRFEEELKRVESEKKIESEERKKAEKMLADMVTERDRQLATLSHKIHGHFKSFELMTEGFIHRIKTNLQISNGTLKEALENPGIEEELKKHLSLSEQYAEEMSKNIEDFVILARTPEMNLQPADLNSFLSGITAELEKEAKSKGLHFKNEISEKLPTISIDSKLLKEGVKELLRNAIDFSPKDSDIGISSHIDADSNAVVIQISDSGFGIPNHLQEKVFQSYFTTQKGRRGLGLTIAKRAVELHQGAITLSSAENHGTHVLISLPIPSIAS